MGLLSLRGSLLSRNRSCLPWQDILVLEVDGMDQAVAYWQIYTFVGPHDSVRACVREHSDVEHRTQWRCPVPSKSYRYDVPEVEFKKMTQILRDFCMSGLKRVFVVLCKFQVVLNACPRRHSGAVNWDWQRHDAGRQTVFKNEGPKLLQTTAQALENCSFLFDSRRSNRDTAPHRFDDANRYALCITFTPFGDRDRDRWLDPDPAQPVRRRCSSPATSRSQFQFECCKRTPVKLIRFRFICKKTSLGGRKQKRKKKRRLIFRGGFVRNLRTMLCTPLFFIGFARFRLRSKRTCCLGNLRCSSVEEKSSICRDYPLVCPCFFPTRFLLLFWSHLCKNCSFTRRYQHDLVLELFPQLGRRTKREKYRDRDGSDVTTAAVRAHEARKQYSNFLFSIFFSFIILGAVE